jgi:hypothetical protein
MVILECVPKTWLAWEKGRYITHHVEFHSLYISNSQLNFSNAKDQNSLFVNNSSSNVIAINEVES